MIIPLTLVQALPVPLPAPSFWEKALDQVPGLAVVCVLMMFVVWRFLSHLAASSIARDATMREISNSCHTVQEGLMTRVEMMTGRSHAALDRNTEAFGRTDALTDEVRAFQVEARAEFQNVRHAILNLANAARIKGMEDILFVRDRGLVPGSVEIMATPPLPPSVNG